MNKNYQYHFLPDLFLRAPLMSWFCFDTDYLRDLLGKQPFQNAIYLASPDFYQLLSGKGFAFKKLSAKERHTLLKYFNRMCYRPTPFGCFATFSLLQWQEEGRGQIDLAGEAGVTINLLPSQELLDSMASANPLNRVTLNPLLYRLGEHYRFVRSTFDKKGKYRFTLELLMADPFYTSLFSFLKNRTVNVPRVIDWIMQQTGCTVTEASGQLTHLINGQVLLTPAQGSTISAPGMQSAKPGSVQSSNFWKRHLSAQLLTKKPLPLAAATFSEIALTNGTIAGKELFYAAAQRPYVSGGLSPTDREELENAIRVLQTLALPTVPAALKQFTEEFKARFDLEAVPLLEATDPDRGIGYSDLASAHTNEGENILNDINFSSDVPASKQMNWTPVHRLLMDLWKRAAASGGAINIRLSDLEGQEFPSANLKFPPTTAVNFRKTEDNLVIEHAGGACATALAGRFSMFSREAAALCRRLAQEELIADPDVAFADIGQVSNKHVDNINRRRPIYPFEIPLNVQSGQVHNRQLRPDDLLLFAHGDELILWSKRLGKRVVPRLATAYNYRNNELAIFRLLCDLQHQGLCTGFGLDLETLFPGMTYYPRVVCGRVVLSPARWLLDGNSIASGRSENETEREKLDTVSRLREAQSLPQKIALGDFDEQLVFDLGRESEALLFLDCIAGQRKITIKEYLNPGRAVRADMMPFAGQFVGFLKHKASIYRNIIPHQTNTVRSLKRDYLPGEEWLYLKIYCTPASANTILTDVVAFVLSLFGSRIQYWFFVRFHDNGHHLRLRFRIAQDDIGPLMAAITDRSKQQRHDFLIKELRSETYRREVERYGARLIDCAERIFCAGSDLLLINLSGKSGLVHPEFRFAMMICFRMISSFLPDQDAAAHFCEQMAESFFREFEVTKDTRAEIDKKYRALGLQAIDVKSLQIPGEMTIAMTRILSELAAAKSIEKDSARQVRFLSDIMHMQLNRVFSTNQRKQEMLVYYFLFKYLRSLKLRQAKA